jgi:tetratricopeptide (TPR) repeat protein
VLIAAGALGVVVAGAVGVAVYVAERDPEPAPIAPSGPAPFTDLEGARAALASTAYANDLKECQAECAPKQLEAAKFPARLDTPGALRLDRCLAACGVAGAGGFQAVALEVLEEKLQAAPAHPCRTELLDDMLDKSPLSDEGRAALSDDVDTCLRHSADARRLRETAKLEAPPWPKKKKRTRSVVAARVTELEKRGRTALAAGEYTRAKELLVEALALDPSHIDDHALIGQAFRGLGDATGAAHHLRLFLHARPDDADAERMMRYLARCKQTYQLKPSSEPNIEERHVRAARLVDDADDTPDHAVALLETAHQLLPDDARISLKLGDAYAAANRPFDARRAFEEAVEKGSSTTAKAARERLAKLGS